MGLSTRQVTNERRAKARALRARGMSYRAIGRELGISNKSVYYLIGPMGRTAESQRHIGAVGTALPPLLPGPKRPDRCSRCGDPGENYLCGKCRSALVVAGRLQANSVGCPNPQSTPSPPIHLSGVKGVVCPAGPLRCPRQLQNREKCGCFISALTMSSLASRKLD